MAPEVVLENDYDGRADIWSLAITAIEMAEINPPNADMHPMRVLLMIPRGLKPKLKFKERWSAEFNDFLSLCFQTDMRLRPTAEVLLKHPFVSNPKSKSILKELVQELKQIKLQKGKLLKQAVLYSDEEEGLSLDEEDQINDQKNSSQHSDDKIKSNFGLDDKLQAIFRQDCTINIPWLNLDYISPLSLISHEDISVTNSSLSDLSPDTIPPTEKIVSNPYLSNLLKTYSYHRNKQDSVPMTPQQAEQTTRIVNELSASLKTILRL